MDIQSSGSLLRNGFLTDEKGQPFFPVGLQAHNSATDTPLFAEAVSAVLAMGGNCVETPVYWCTVEPSEGVFDFGSVKRTIDTTRENGLRLILLWFGTSKNGHPNYIPEYMKMDPETYRPARGADGAPVMSLSPHCRASLEKDRRAFAELMRFLREYDSDRRTVLGVQVENEMGYANTDMDYGPEAAEAYRKPVPAELEKVVLDDDGREDLPADKEGLSPWKIRFGRYSHEAFSAWYHAVYVNEIAKAGKEEYSLPLFLNVMVGENGIEEAGKSYNAGAAVTRVLDIWKAGAPFLDMIGPDIYNPERSAYERICRGYSRQDNPLFIPESPIRGEANAMNMVLAAGQFEAVGVFAFGAESALDGEGNVTPECRSLSLTMQAIRAVSPLLVKCHGKGCIYGIAQEEFESFRYLKLKDYHAELKFLSANPQYMGNTPELAGADLRERGRAILVQTGEREFYLAGAGVSLFLTKRPAAADEQSYPHLTSRTSTQLNFLSVDEGHFENDEFVTDFRRNGDATNFGQYVLNGQLIRIRLAPVPC